MQDKKDVFEELSHLQEEEATKRKDKGERKTKKHEQWAASLDSLSLAARYLKKKFPDVFHNCGQAADYAITLTKKDFEIIYERAKRYYNKWIAGFTTIILSAFIGSYFTKSGELIQIGLVFIALLSFVGVVANTVFSYRLTDWTPQPKELKGVSFIL